MMPKLGVEQSLVHYKLLIQGLKRRPSNWLRSKCHRCFWSLVVTSLKCSLRNKCLQRLMRVWVRLRTRTSHAKISVLRRWSRNAHLQSLQGVSIIICCWFGFTAISNVLFRAYLAKGVVMWSFIWCRVTLCYFLLFWAMLPIIFQLQTCFFNSFYIWMAWIVIKTSDIALYAVNMLLFLHSSLGALNMVLCCVHLTRRCHTEGYTAPWPTIFHTRVSSSVSVISATRGGAVARRDVTSRVRVHVS